MGCSKWVNIHWLSSEPIDSRSAPVTASLLPGHRTEVERCTDHTSPSRSLLPLWVSTSPV